MEFGIFSARTSSSRLRCCIESCRSRSDKNLNLRYHIFPRENEPHISIINSFGSVEKIDRFKAWKKACKLENVTRYTRICSLHFSRDDYILPDIHTSRRHLKKTAIPKYNLDDQGVLKDSEIGSINNENFDQSEEKNNQVSDEEMIIPERDEISNENESILDVKTGILLTDKNQENESYIEAVIIDDVQGSSKTQNMNPSLNQLYFAIPPSMIAPNFITPTFVTQKSVKDAEAQVNTDDIVPRFTRFITTDSELKVSTGLESFAVLNKIADIVKSSNDYKFEQTTSRMNTKDRIIMTTIWLKQDLSYCFLCVMFKAYSPHRTQQVIFNMINLLADCLKDIGSKQIYRFHKRKQTFKVFETKVQARLAPIIDNIIIVVSAILTLNSYDSNYFDDNDDDDSDI